MAGERPQPAGSHTKQAVQILRKKEKQFVVTMSGVGNAMQNVAVKVLLVVVLLLLVAVLGWWCWCCWCWC